MTQRFLLLLTFLISFGLAAGCTDDGGSDPTPDAAPAKSCKGVVESCSALTGIDCVLQDGCSSQSDACTGVPESCESQFSSFSCDSQPGCYWSSSGSYCSGSPEACSLAPGPNTCAGEAGCTWSPGTCSGTAHRCADQSDDYLCTSQLGCVWE